MKLEFEIADSSPCFHRGAEVLFNESDCLSCKNEMFPRFTIGDILLNFYEGSVIDVRAGGLFLGRYHDEDDIPMLQPVAQGLFQLTGVMQGNEYIVNKKATAINFKRIEEINSYKDTYEAIETIKLTKTVRVFNTNGIKEKLFVIVERGQYVINRAATSKYFQELEEINNSFYE